MKHSTLEVIGISFLAILFIIVARPQDKEVPTTQFATAANQTMPDIGKKPKPQFEEF